MTPTAAAALARHRQSGFNPAMQTAVEVVHFGESFLLQ